MLKLPSYTVMAFNSEIKGTFIVLSHRFKLVILQPIFNALSGRQN